MLEFILGALSVFILFGYFGLPIAWWTLAGGLLAWYPSVVAGFGVAANAILAAAFVVIAAVLNIPALRRAAISNRVLAIYRRILPDMSQTEKEAINAGTVWWDGDLFSGRPDWDKLLATPAPPLGAQGEAVGGGRGGGR